MSDPKVLTLAALFDARDAESARRRAEAADAERRKREERMALAERIMHTDLSEADKAEALAKIRKAFLAGEKEVMLMHFPSELCLDSGRHINNHLEGWQDTLPGEFHQVFQWWEGELKPGGFGFSARIIDYPGGMPGDVGLFVTWPEMRG